MDDLLNVSRSWAQVFAAIVVGRMYPRIRTWRADFEYINLPRDVFYEISEKVVLRMIKEGITYEKFYMSDFFDCVEFSRCFADYFVQEMRIDGHGVDGKGCPIVAMGYNDKKRGGHACVCVIIDGDVEYYEPYPDYFRLLNLDKEEVASMRPMAL